MDISRTGFYLFYKLQAGTALGYMMVTVTLRLEGGLRYNSVLGAKSLTASTIAAEGRAGANTLPEPPSLFLACWPGSRTRRDSTRNKKTETDGWADETFLIKHCVLSPTRKTTTPSWQYLWLYWSLAFMPAITAIATITWVLTPRFQAGKRRAT